jgi:hypothetical protein
VDGGQVLPPDTELLRGLAVVAHQLVRRRRGDDAPRRQLRLRLGQAEQVDEGVGVRDDDAVQVLRHLGEHGRA